MSRVYIVVEGPTEESFVNVILAPELNSRGVELIPIIIGKPGHRGGNVSYPRLKRDVLIYLKQERNAYCTTFIDFYGRKKGFPCDDFSGIQSSDERVRKIEDAMKADVIVEAGDALRADARFLPYIQLHEFEGLLFSDPGAFAKGIYAPELSAKFENVRRQFKTPEEINDSPITAPSKRVLQLCPEYNKPLSGTLAALEVGLPAMRRESPRFNAWVGKLESLNEQHF